MAANAASSSAGTAKRAICCPDMATGLHLQYMLLVFCLVEVKEYFVFVVCSCLFFFVLRTSFLTCTDWVTVVAVVVCWCSLCGFTLAPITTACAASPRDGIVSLGSQMQRHVVACRCSFSSVGTVQRRNPYPKLAVFPLKMLSSVCVCVNACFAPRQARATDSHFLSSRAVTSTPTFNQTD